MNKIPTTEYVTRGSFPGFGFEYAAPVIAWAAVFMLMSSAAQADSVLDAFKNPQMYTEYKSEIKFKSDTHTGNIDTLRFGAKFNNFYIESGAATGEFGTGMSTEIGYKFNIDEHWDIKGKWEGTENHPFVKHKLETEIRYTF